MKMKSLAFALVISSAVTGTANAAVVATRADLNTLLGSSQTYEDFEKFTNTSQIGAAGTLSSTSNWANQGVGKVAAGASYSAVGGTRLIFLNVNGYYGLNSHTLGDSSGSQPIDISYTTPVTAFGLDLQSYRGLDTNGTITVYDTAGVILAAFSVQGGTNGAANFFGYQSNSNIGRVNIISTNGYIMIDNHGYGLASAATGAVPEPATWAMMIAGFGLVGRAMRRRSTKIAFA